MKKYHVMEALFLSFYSKSLYQDVAKEWKGLALGYLLLVIAICWLPFSFDFHRFINQGRSILPGIISQVPNITISKGNLSIDKPVPYTIKEPDDQTTLVIFDTSGQYTSIEQTNAFMLVTKNKVIVRNGLGPGAKVTYYSVEKFGNMNISKEDVEYIMDKIIFIISILMYPLAVIISFAYRFLEALFLGGIGFLFGKFFHVSLTYKTNIRLAVIALTPALILTTMAEYFSWPIFYIKFFSLILPVVYVFYAIYAQKNIEQTTVDTQKEA